MGETPRAVVLTQEVDECIDVQATRLRAHAKHHAVGLK